MTKISVEFCIISARGLGRRSTLLNPQWFSVAWIDPNSKYCTKIDASGNSDVNWGTKFSLSVDEHDMSMQQMELTVEVYRREPVFLREHLQGTAVIQMKEYFDKFSQGKDPSGVTEETSNPMDLLISPSVSARKKTIVLRSQVKRYFSLFYI